MRLLFVNQHYWPDVASTGQHLTDLCEHLAATGFEVEVLCSRAQYLAGALEAPKQETRNGVRIRRIGTFGFGRGSHLGRIADYFGFYVQVLWHVLCARRRDLVITLTTPPLLCLVGAVVKLVRRQRFGIWSMDLHPDAEEVVGMIRKSGVLAKVLHALNNVGYRNADRVIALGPVMRRRVLEKGVKPEYVATIPVWNKRDEIYPIDKSQNPLFEELGLERLREKFVIMYSGNAGLAHRFDEVLEAMRLLKERGDLFFLFAGGGAKRERIAQFVSENNIENFRYLDYLPREKLKYSLAIGDLHLVTLESEMAGIAAPGKVYGIMAAERPILMVGPQESEPGEAARKAACGVIIDPMKAHNPTKEVVRSIEELAADREKKADMGRRGRNAFLDHYEQQICCNQWKEVLKRDH